MQQVDQSEYWKYLKHHSKIPYSWEFIHHHCSWSDWSSRGVQTNVWKSRNFLGKTAKHPCLPKIQTEVIQKCMSALKPDAHLQDRSMSSPRGWVDQLSWRTECQAAHPCDGDHCHTTGWPCSVQELRELLGQEGAAGLCPWSWRQVQGTWDLGPWSANSESCSCFQPPPQPMKNGWEIQ